MANGFIESNIARGNRNLLIIGLVLIIIGGGLGALFGNLVPAVIAVPGIVALVVWLIRMINPKSHPVYKRLARYGDAHNIAEQVNQEFAGVRTSDNAQFGPNWLAQRYVYGLFLVPWVDVAWLHIYTHIRNGVRADYVRVWSRDGRQFVAPAGMKQSEAEQLLLQLCARAPWAEVGYSPELLKLWTKRRSEFVQRVDARRERAWSGR